MRLGGWLVIVVILSLGGTTARSADLACALDVVPDSPRAGESFIVMAIASRGRAPYTFSGLALGPGGKVLSDISSFSDTGVVATGTYASVGSHNVTLSLTDASGNTAVCSTRTR